MRVWEAEEKGSEGLGSRLGAFSCGAELIRLRKPLCALGPVFPWSSNLFGNHFVQ